MSLVLSLLLALAPAGAPPAAGQAQASPPDADTPEQTEDARERLQRMRGTGSRAGFRHDTRPAGKLAGKGRQQVVTREEGEVAPRPTRWREESVGGKTVHKVRFRREGEPGDDDDP